MPVLPTIFKLRDFAPRHLKFRPGSSPACNRVLHSREERAAFTLIEVMVSTLILLLIILMFSSIFSNVSLVWREGLADIDRSNNGGIACDLIGRDIQSALLPANRSNTANLQFVVNPTGLGTSYSARDSIFFQAPVVVGSTSGDIAEVGYFVQWDLTTASNPRARLCRFYVNSSDTTNFLIYSNPAAWITPQAIINVASATRSTTPPYQGLLAENVVGLWITCLDPYGYPITLEASGTAFPVSGSGSAFDSRLGYTDSAGTVHAVCSLPAAVDISFIIIDGTTASRVNPTLHSAINTLVQSTSSASAFFTQAQTTTGLASIRSAFQPFSLRVHLVNSQ